MQDDARSAYVSFAGHITDATNTYLLAVEVLRSYSITVSSPRHLSCARNAHVYACSVLPRSLALRQSSSICASLSCAALRLHSVDCMSRAPAHLLRLQAYLKLKRPALASTLLLELAGALEVCLFDAVAKKFSVNYLAF